MNDKVKRAPHSPLVMKFGGTSVGDGAAFSRAARLVAGQAEKRPVAVVVSAMSGVTDALLGYVEGAAGTGSRTSTGATREGSLAELHRSLSDRHLAAAREAVTAEYLPEVEGRIPALLRSMLESLGREHVSEQARRAEVVVHGERLSAAVLAGAIRSLGVSAEVAGDPIATDSGFSEAEIDTARTRERCMRHVAPILDGGAVAVVPGFVGRSEEGLCTTLGRGGSDLSATALGRALGSSEVWILTDVNGVLDADPRLVPDASLMDRLSYREARIFAELGAKVLHPRTMEPASEGGIEVRVASTFNPACDGTRVSGIEDGKGVRCVALRREMLIEIPCASGRKDPAAMVVCIGSPGREDLARGSRSLRGAGIPFLHAGKAVAGLVFVVPAEHAEEALRTLHETFVREEKTYAGEVVA